MTMRSLCFSVTVTVYTAPGNNLTFSDGVIKHPVKLSNGVYKRHEIRYTQSAQYTVHSL